MRPDLAPGFLCGGEQDGPFFSWLRDHEEHALVPARDVVGKRTHHLNRDGPRQAHAKRRGPCAAAPNLLSHWNGQEGQQGARIRQQARPVGPAARPAEPACHHQEQSQRRQAHRSQGYKAAVPEHAHQPPEGKHHHGREHQQTA